MDIVRQWLKSFSNHPHPSPSSLQTIRLESLLSWRLCPNKSETTEGNERTFLSPSFPINQSEYWPPTQPPPSAGSGQALVKGEQNFRLHRHSRAGGNPVGVNFFRHDLHSLRSSAYSAVKQVFVFMVSRFLFFYQYSASIKTMLFRTFSINPESDPARGWIPAFAGMTYPTCRPA